MASITKRTTGDGEVRYDARVRIGDRVQTRTFRRRADAERWARDREVRKDRGDLFDARAGFRPLGEYASAWIAGRSLAPRTRELYEDLLRRHLEPHLGTTPLVRLTTDRIRGWWSTVATDVSPLQAAKAYRLLRAILNTAVADGLLARNPCVVPGAGRERSAERPLVEPEQLLALADAIDPRYRAVVLLASTGALRLGEILGLRRRHVDLAARAVVVHQQAQELRDGTVIVRDPKTAAGRRTVALPDFVADALADHLDRHVERHPDAWLFTGPRGGLVRRPALHHRWDEARRAVGLADLTMHDLRHAGATLAAWSGASTKDLMARLGHASPRAALRYQHAAQRRDREIADRLGELFDR